MFFLWLILIFALISFLFAMSSTEIEFKDLEINVPKIRNEIIDKNSKIYFRIYLLGKLKIVDLNLDKTKLEKEKLKNRFKKIEDKLKKDKNNFDLDVFKGIKFLNINFKKFDLKICIGTEDAAITAILVGAIAGTLGFMLKRKISNKRIHRYEVNPVYQNKNILNIKLNGIFVINVRNIIYIIYKIIENRRVKKNDRTSNRGAYVYSNE